MNRLRIAIAVLGAPAGRKGGVDVYAAGLARALGTYGKEHQYVALTLSDEFDCGLKTVNLNRQSLSSKTDTVWWHMGVRDGAESIGEFKLARAIERVAQKHQLNVIHFPATRLPVSQVRTRAILTFFDMQYVFLPQFFKADEAALIDRVYRNSVAQAEWVIAPTRFTMDSLRDKYGVPAEKMSLIPAGIADELKPASAEEIEQVREQYNIRGPYCVYPANPWPHKNHLNLLKAIRLLKDRKVDVPQLVLTGRLPGKEDVLGKLIEELGLRNQVLDLGFVPKKELDAIVSGAAMLVFPSLFEGFGYPVVEAMACGCPVASTNSACMPDVVGDAGLLFDPQSVESIADAIESLAVRKEGVSQLIQRGLERSSRFKWSRIIPELEDFYSRSEQLSKSRRSG